MLNFVLVAGNRVICISESSEAKALFREYCVKYRDKINRHGFVKKGTIATDFAKDVENFIEIHIDGVI